MSFLFLLFGFATKEEFCDVDDALLDPGLGRNGIVGVVGVSGGVWLGVEGADVPGVTVDDWLSDKMETGGMTCANTSLSSVSFFASSAKSTI